MTAPQLPQFVRDRMTRRADCETARTARRCLYGCRAHARPYPGGTYCEQHAPQPTNPSPDPARTLTGLRQAAGLNPDATFLPSHTILDQRAIASGRRASGDLRRASHEPTIDEKFRAFHARNAHVMQRLVELVEQHVSDGARRVSIGGLFEELRGSVETNGNSYRLDNSLRAPYVRALIADHPHWERLFETRERRSA